MDIISEFSKNEINKAIAFRCSDNMIEPTKEEAIELTYEISQNKEFYLELLTGDYNDKCKSDAFEVLRDIYPSKSDSEINAMIK